MENINEAGGETVAPGEEILPLQFLKADESRFESVIVAAKRCKQLNNGAKPRITANLWKRKNTSVAIEEVRDGLIVFTTAEADK